jgi:hypothetical protein
LVFEEIKSFGIFPGIRAQVAYRKVFYYKWLRVEELSVGGRWGGF